MIQFNLLPDVKVEYIKTRWRKRVIILVSAISAAVMFAIFFLLLLYVRVNQPAHMSDLNKDIKTNVEEIQAVEGLDEILTIQNQLNSLPGLHDQKVVSSRLVDYLTRLTPNQATISDVTLDFEASTLVIKGNANSLGTVNKYADTLKFTEYKINDEGEATGKAFKDVVLQSFAVAGSGQSGADAISYELTMVFEPAIFALVRDSTNPAEPVTLKVPQIISTRSATETPDTLFAPQPTPPQPVGPPQSQIQGGQR